MHIYLQISLYHQQHQLKGLIKQTFAHEEKTLYLYCPALYI